MNTTRTLVLGAALGTFLLAGTALGQHSHDGPAADHQPFNPAPAAQPQAPVPNPNPEGPHPRLVFEATEHDFGHILDDGKAEFKFRFRNEGDAPLKFTIPFRVTCGCTAGDPRSDKNPDMVQTEFAPGESGFISVSFSAQGKHGEQKQDIFVTSNDPRQPELKLNIKSYVRQMIQVEPPLVSFGEVMSDQPSTQVVKVRGPLDFKVTYATTTKPRFIKAKVIETKEVEIHGERLNESTIHLTYMGGAPRGTMSALCTARTTSDKYPLKDISVNAEVVGDIQILPPRINVGILEQEQEFTRIFRVSSRTGRSFKVLNVEQQSTSLQEPLQISVTEAEPGSQSSYQVEVKGKSPANPGQILAALNVVTDVPNDDKIGVQLNGLVRAPAAAAQPQQPVGVFAPPPGPKITVQPAPATEPQGEQNNPR